MRFRSLVSVLVAVVLVAGACTSTNPTSSPQGSLPPGSTQAPGASGSAPTTGPGVSIEPGASGTPVAGTPSQGATETPGPGATETPPVVEPTKTPKPLKLAPYPRNGKRNAKKIALTFDADMYPFMYANIDNYTEYDKRVIKLLKDEDVHATIFLNGLYVKAYPDLVADLADEPGIELANHSWDHANWTGCTDPLAPDMDNRRTQITRTNKIITDTTDIEPFWFRFPGGCSAGDDLELVKDEGMWGVGWECYFGDSLGWDGARQAANVKNTCREGSIVITHMNNTKYHPGVYDALKELIPWWKKNGWEIVNVGELLGRPTPTP